MESKKVLEFVHYVEGLKDELRHNWTSEDRHESVAEHSWRMAMMAIVFAPKLEKKLDMEKVLKMVVVHDLAEIEVGDIPSYMYKEKEEQEKLEVEAMGKLAERFDDDSVREIVDLWGEYMKLESLEAKFVKALDKIEVRVQHNESKMSRWNDVEYSRSQYVADKWCEYDNFLKEFNELVKEESKKKIVEESDKDFDKVMKEVGK